MSPGLTVRRARIARHPVRRWVALRIPGARDAAGTEGESG